MNKPLDFIQVSRGRSERWSIKNLAKTRPKMKGGVKFFTLKNLSSNLYSTFQKCAFNTRKMTCYTTVFMQGGVCFMPPYTTFTPPLGIKMGYSSALKYSQKWFFTPPFRQKSCHPALQAGLQSIGSIQGGINLIYLVLKGGVKGVVKKYATLNKQGVVIWQF